MSSADTATAGDVPLLRELARSGRLAEVAGTAAPREYGRLAAAAYEIAWPLVFQRVTRPVERRRGHWRCSSGLTRLAADCLDGFHDDVEAVVADVLTGTRAGVRDLEAWICSRLTAATVDGNRRRRGLRGALQRPRMPGWLRVELRRDPWHERLALLVLDWAGVPETAGLELWPLDAWVQRRAEVTGDWTGSDRTVLLADLEVVLAAMRRRAGWYVDYVERPLGAKAAPVAAPPGDAPGDSRPLPAVTPEERDDALLVELARVAVEAIAAGLDRGEEPHDAVTRALGLLLGADPGIDRAPGATGPGDAWLSALLADPGAVDRLTARAVGIVTGRG